MPRVLVIGGGGREHALVWGLLRSPSKPEVIGAPGNAGIAAVCECLPISATDLSAICEVAVSRAVDLVVVGPEAPLVIGLGDRLRAHGIAVFGPSGAAARLEGSKAFSKEVMITAGVPTARGDSFTDVALASAFADRFEGRVAVKADGLAAGKGVIVTEDRPSAREAIAQILGGSVGDAGRRVVIEERLEGEEISVLALCDGTRTLLLPAAQDHKRVGEGDRGPNTGGMGAYSPPPRVSPDLLSSIEARCIAPILSAMSQRGAPFRGVLFAGLMLTPDGPRVLEYNVRFGDPETQAIIPRIDGDLYALLHGAATGTLEKKAFSVQPRASIAIVLAAENYPGEPRIGDVIAGLDQVPDDVLVFHAGTKKRGTDYVTAGGRVITVAALGDTLAEAKARAERGARAITWRGQHWRRDIGWRALPSSSG